VLEHFKPAAFEKYEWAGLRSVKDYMGVTVFVIVCLLIDCNNFFYKALVWVPPNHNILMVRICLWGFAAIATSEEWYEYVSNENQHRLGPFAWMTFYTALIELSSVIKFSTGKFTEPFPTWIVCVWTVLGAVYSYGFYIAWQNGQKLPTSKFNSYNPAVETVQHGKKSK